MWLIFIYAPILLCLPILALVGIVFVVVPGGFIIVLGGLYWALLEFIGLFGLAASRRSRAARSSRRESRPSLALAPRDQATAVAPAGEVAATSIATALRNDRVRGPAPNVLVGRPRGPRGEQIRVPADVAQDREPQDGARAA